MDDKTVGYAMAGTAGIIGYTIYKDFQADKQELLEIDYNKLFGLSLIVGGAAMISYYSLKPRPRVFDLMGVMASTSGLIVTLAMK